MESEKLRSRPWRGADETQQVRGRCVAARGLAARGSVRSGVIQESRSSSTEFTLPCILSCMFPGLPVACFAALEALHIYSLPGGWRHQR